MDTDVPASEWRGIEADSLKRLAWWQERRYVEGLMRKRERGFDLAAHEEAAIAYSPFGTAAGCAARGFLR